MIKKIILLIFIIFVLNISFTEEIKYLGADSCSQCHTKVFNEWKASAHSKLSYKDNQKIILNVECETCHGPGELHIKSNNKKNINKYVLSENTCYSCHANEKDNQALMVEGKTNQNYPHKNFIDKKCLGCHDGHKLKPEIKTCKSCHYKIINFDYNGRQTEIKKLLNELNSLLKSYYRKNCLKDKWNSEINKDIYKWAKKNYNFILNDGSYGVHNHDYAKELLTSSIKKLKNMN